MGVQASLDFLETNRDILFVFTNDTLQFLNNAAFYALREETRAYLQNRSTKAPAAVARPRQQQFMLNFRRNKGECSKMCGTP